MDEYRSLYRRYRPQSPDEVLGQEHVVRALAGAVREGKLAHAFLFSGPRGTGKTSTARILAKMVNCEQGPTAEPCGTCEQCVRIRDGAHLDVVEIDAASHGGVDDARELRERAPTAPAQGREKVYIIDEAQRLSREAFDALLKLFEEPPDGVRFLLATTEAHKMPATIIGRCQRFEFRRIPAETIAGHLAAVADSESISLEPAAAEAIAREAEGSIRDALSLLDQASLLGAGDVTERVIATLIGAPDLDVHAALADAVAVGDAKDVFGIIHRLVQDGHDLRHFAARLTGHFRNLLLALAAPEDSELIDVSPDLHPRLVAQAQKFSSGELDRILSLLLQAQTDMRWSTAPRLTLELALVRAAMPETDPQPAALRARMERLERLAGIEEAAPEPSEQPAEEAPKAVQKPKEETPKGQPKKEALPESRERPAPGPRAPDAGAVDAEMLRRSWQEVVEALKARRRMILYANTQVATVGGFDGQTLDLVFPPGREFAAAKVEEKADELRDVLTELFGIAPAIRCSVREGTVALEDADEPPLSPQAAEELVRAQFGAEVVEQDDA
ncbi:MAG: DNA polymerase III subunit gamma/tau [Actinomycetota bacterium]